MSKQTHLSIQDMIRLVDDYRELSFLESQSKQQQWESEQHAKSEAIVPLLKEQLSSTAFQELLDLTGTAYGLDCFQHALHGRSGSIGEWFPF